MSPSASSRAPDEHTLAVGQRGCRILALLTDGFGATGGIARYNADLMTALSQSSRVESVVVLPRSGDASEIVPPAVHQLSEETGWMRWSARAAALGLRHRFDVIFCGHINAAPVAAMMAQVTGARLWIQVHGIEAWEPRGRAIGASIAGADLVTSVSRFTRTRLLGWARTSPERVRVLPNTVRGAFRSGRQREDLVLRYRLAGRKVILTVGRLAGAERYKGHDRVIRALAGLPRSLGPVAYMIVGSGDDRPRLEGLARELDVSELVLFVGQIPDEQLADYFALADVYAMPSTGEGFGIVFLEAAASGLHVIGGNRDGSVDALAEGAIGCLADPEDEPGLRAALVEALSQPVGPSTTGNDAVARFRFENFARHVDDLVGVLMSG